MAVPMVRLLFLRPVLLRSPTCGRTALRRSPSVVFLPVPIPVPLPQPEDVLQVHPQRLPNLASLLSLRWHVISLLPGTLLLVSGM